MIRLGLLRENQAGERRVALTPEAIRKLLQKKASPFQVMFEPGCGQEAGFEDAEYQAAGAESVDLQGIVSRANVLLKIHRFSSVEMKTISSSLRPEALLICLLEPSTLGEEEFQFFKQFRLNLLALEAIPRISRAQSMDVLSSQANLAGYRAVLEAAIAYPRFFPLMMTSAGSTKPAKVLVLGAGVAGLQAIATARRLGAQVEAYDVRPEAQEQIRSLGAIPVTLQLEESGVGQGGYAQQLSSSTLVQQQKTLAEKIKKADIVIATANVPGKKAPLLITAEAVSGMRPGSVIVDLATASGGNCEGSQKDQVLHRGGVTILGWSNYAARIPQDASHFFAHNLVALLNLLIHPENQQLFFPLEDEIIATALQWQGGSRRS